MAYIGIQPAEKFTSFATQTFSVSATTSYTLDHAVANENEIALFVNNVRQQPGSGKAYTATGTALTLSAATATTDTMYCIFLGRALQTVTPATNSITAAMVSANAITGAKLNTDVISAQTALTSAPADTDEFLVSDAGTIKRIDYSLIKGGTNTPAFLATMSASQNPSSATTTLVNFNQTTYDTASAFDTTNKKYVIPSAGYYHIYANAYMYNASNDLDRLICYLNIGGSTRFQTDVQIPNSPACFCYVGGVYNCSANDDVEIKIYQVMGSGTTTIPTDKNYFGGYKLIS